MSLVSSKMIKAQLNVEQGSVLVNGESVSGEAIILKQGDIIETSGNGLATVILYESIVINLESGTKINIDDLSKDNPVISQESGETWNQITKLFGIESYDVKVGNSVASVRGTGFGITGKKIFVGEGEVKYDSNGNQIQVTEGEAVDDVNGKSIERGLTSEERDKIKKGREKAIEQLKKLRKFEIAKHPRVVEFAKNKYELTDADLDQGLEDADNGIIKLREIKDQIPFGIESFEKIIKITDEIRKLKGQA